MTKENMPSQQTCYEGWKTALQACSKYARRIKRLTALLADARAAIGQEFSAMGDDWKDQPIMRAKSKLLDRIDNALCHE